MDRAMAILEAVASSKAPLGVSQISSQLGVPLGSAYRQLQRLVAAGLLEQDAASSLYRLGERAFRIAHLISKHRGSKPARDVLDEISARTTFSTLLGKLVGDSFVYVEHRPSTGSLSVRGEIGASGPLHATAIGKALLSTLPSDRYEELVAGLPLDRFSDRTITERPALDAEIEGVRAQGYACSKAEFEPQIGSVAVPFHVEAEPATGTYALCIAGHVSDLDELTTWVEELRRAADRLEGLM